jgi:hypothetical protein
MKMLCTKFAIVTSGLHELCDEAEGAIVVVVHVRISVVGITRAVVRPHELLYTVCMCVFSAPYKPQLGDTCSVLHLGGGGCT